MASTQNQLVAVTLSTLFASAALAQEWTIVNLHPGGSSSSCIGVSGGQQVGYAFGRPGIWSGSAGSWRELYLPPGYENYWVTGIDAGRVVGYGDYRFGYPPRYRVLSAFLWRENGTLEYLPLGIAFGISGSRQVGEYHDSQVSHKAAMCSGSDNPRVILDFGYSTAAGCDSEQQVGYKWFSEGYHASLWTGTAESWVDLHPAGSSSSVANGVHAGEQVGACVISGNTRACLWRGTAASWVDLAPPGSESSSTYAVYEGMQVGYGRIGGLDRASLWHGSADSWVDLSAYLPSEYSGRSEARGISSDGEFIYVVGSAYTLSGQQRAVLWKTPLPPCHGDIDGNRIADLEDLAVLLAHYGTPEGATSADGDLDGDGDVDLQDLAVLLARFGSTCL